MSYKLKPYDLTNLLLKSGFTFDWGGAHDRLYRFDKFISDFRAKFVIVDWSTCSPDDVNKAKIDLMSLCADQKLREVVEVVANSKSSLTFDEMVKMIRKKLMKSYPPLHSLANLLSESQRIGESFEKYFNRVKDTADTIDWESYSSDNIKNILIATTFACRSNNPYVKGHCMAIRDMEKIQLQEILDTALEYEEKNPPSSSFPSIGRPPFFGQSSGGLFGSAPPTTSLFGQSNPPVPKKCTHSFFSNPSVMPNSGIPISTFGFGSSKTDPPTGSSSTLHPTAAQPSFEENRSGLFGSHPTFKTAPFGGGFKSNNIFMTEKSDTSCKDGEASSSQQGDREIAARPPEKRQRTVTGPSTDMNPNVP